VTQAGISGTAITALHLCDAPNSLECVVIRAGEIMRQPRQVVVARAAASDEVRQRSAALGAGRGNRVRRGLEFETREVHGLRGLLAESARAHSSVLATRAVAVVQGLCSGHAVDGGCRNEV
jgi:hypothetical protein